MPVRDLLMSASGVSTTPTYVDDVFSTYLYTGTGTNQAINNGIDIAGKGGAVWVKARSAATSNLLWNTVSGTSFCGEVNTTNGHYNRALGSFNSNGFSTGIQAEANGSGVTFASWSFRKQSKFFDVVQYTGTGSVQNIAHSLGSTPGCIIVKQSTTSNGWYVYNKGVNGGVNPEQYYLNLNQTSAQSTGSTVWNNTAPTSTQFTVGTGGGVNASGQTYIAYIFADQAGGFGATGTDSAIACNYFTTDASGNATVNLGWEPQYILIKSTVSAEDWYIFDIMRGFSQTQANYLFTDSSSAESVVEGTRYLSPNATGFSSYAGFLSNSTNYIYIAIRRPNKPPTIGTSVFSPNIEGGSTTIPTGFPVDLSISTVNPGGDKTDFDRLRGSSTTSSVFLNTNSTSAETTYGGGIGFDNNTAIIDVYQLYSGTTFWSFKRAPTFFDEVVYTATNATTTLPHNLTVAPEMMIIKNRSAASGWYVYHKSLHGGVNPQQYYLALNVTNAQNATANTTVWGNTAPTSTQFTVGNLFGSTTNSIVSYLFATCAGVSKVGSYTGNGTGQSIACGFGSGGARFILIKRTDSTGDWYCFDSANGLTSGSSPYLLWNSTAAQTTGNNGCYTSSGGFTLTSSASATVNVNGGSYIFLAIA
jgi:hypothetical protein